MHRCLPFKVLIVLAAVLICGTALPVHADETVACTSGEYVLTTSGLTPVRRKQEKEFASVDRSLKFQKSGRFISLFTNKPESSRLLMIDRQSVLERPCLSLKRKYRAKGRSAAKNNKAPLIRRAQCSCNAVIVGDGMPNDPNAAGLWGMVKINALTAWDVTTTTGDKVIAIIDSGVDYNHPDLRANMWVNPKETPGNNRDDDGNGVVDDIYGFNAEANNGNPLDTHGHGTHVAGTIGAKGNNGIGVAGVAWTTKLMAVRFLGANNQGSLYDAVEGIDYVTTMKNRGVPIIASNNSWGAAALNSSIRASIVRAQNAGLLFIAAAGNSGLNTAQSPASPACETVDNIIAVAALDPNGTLSSYSNYGSGCVDVAAPGTGIYSTLPNSQYGSLTGTSMAAPHVTGLIGLMAGRSPNSAPSTIRSTLFSSVTVNSAFNGKVGYGQINANAGVRAVGPAPTNTPTPTRTAPAKTATPTPTRTPTATSTPTKAPSPSATRTATRTPTRTATPTATRTTAVSPPTRTPTPTRTAAPTNTPTPTRTPTPVITPSATPTRTATPTPTATIAPECLISGMHLQVLETFNRNGSSTEPLYLNPLGTPADSTKTWQVEENDMASVILLNRHTVLADKTGTAPQSRVATWEPASSARRFRQGVQSINIEIPLQPAAGSGRSIGIQIGVPNGDGKRSYYRGDVTCENPTIQAGCKLRLFSDQTGISLSRDLTLADKVADGVFRGQLILGARQNSIALCLKDETNNWTSLSDPTALNPDEGFDVSLVNSDGYGLDTFTVNSSHVVVQLTPTPTRTATATPTSTRTTGPTATATATASATATRTATATATPTRTATSTATPANTSSPTATATATFTRTATPTATLTRTATPTVTPTGTRTPQPTNTATPTATHTATRTAVPTATAVFTSTATATPTATRTRTPVPTGTSTRTPLPTATPRVQSTATPAPTSTATPEPPVIRRQPIAVKGKITLEKRGVPAPLQAELTKGLMKAKIRFKVKKSLIMSIPVNRRSGAFDTFLPYTDQTYTVAVSLPANVRKQVKPVWTLKGPKTFKGVTDQTRLTIRYVVAGTSAKAPVTPVAPATPSPTPGKSGNGGGFDFLR